MNVIIQTNLILGAMARKEWSLSETAIMCRIDYTTLAGDKRNPRKGILKGFLPKRIDAMYRLCNGLGLQVEDVLKPVAPAEKMRAEIRRIK